jgi:hypothetical protein
MTWISLIVCLVLFTAVSARAQSLDDLYLDLAVPDFPGMGVLKLNAARVSRPGPIKELAVSLLSVVDEGRTVSPGVALAWAPKETFPGESLDEYRTGLLRRIVFSLATVKSGRSTVLGAGGRAILYDRSRPTDDAAFLGAVEDALGSALIDDARAVLLRARMRNDVERFVVDVVRLLRPAAAPGDRDVERLRDVWTLPPQAPPAAELNSELKQAQFLTIFGAIARELGQAAPALPEPLAAELARTSTDFVLLAFQLADDQPALIRTIRQRIERQKWNAASLYVDVAVSWMSTDSSWAAVRPRTAGILAAASFPVGRAAHGVVQVAHRQGLGGDEPRHRSLSMGARLLAGNQRSRLSIEGATERREHEETLSSEWSGRATLGTEFRVADGLWIEIALGSEFDAASGPTIISLANVKYTFRTKPRFVIPSRR